MKQKNIYYCWFTENVYNKMTQVHYGATMLKDNSKNFNVLLRLMISRMHI